MDTIIMFIEAMKTRLSGFFNRNPKNWPIQATVGFLPGAKKIILFNF
jgi:hypothetical protein